MAEIARDYHMRLQQDESGGKSPGAREADIARALNTIERRVQPERAVELGNEITYEECEFALRFSKSTSAPGLDGLTYEMWKTLHARFTEDSRHEDRDAFDVLAVLVAAFRDVQLYGVCETTGFTDGWIHLLYG
ncbi:hypothetical protein C8Q80DRAFT_1222148 [Daedaleopsis nitida]|nr:hypothetical protein C8Q80DRAFT_1222148 [Daedaleopsis nitida]